MLMLFVKIRITKANFAKFKPVCIKILTYPNNEGWVIKVLLVYQ